MGEFLRSRSCRLTSRKRGISHLHSDLAIDMALEPHALWACICLSQFVPAEFPFGRFVSSLLPLFA